MSVVYFLFLLYTQKNTLGDLFTHLILLHFRISTSSPVFATEEQQEKKKTASC